MLCSWLCRIVLKTLTMTQGRSWKSCSVEKNEAALALASAGCTVRMQVLTCDATLDDLGAALMSKEKPTPRILITIWMSVMRDVAHLTRFLLEFFPGGVANSTKCCLYRGGTSCCVFWACQKRSLREAKEILQIREKPFGNWLKSFLCKEKKESVKGFGHEYN